MNIDITMNEEMANEIEARAASLKLTAGDYIEMVLQECLESGSGSSA